MTSQYFIRALTALDYNEPHNFNASDEKQYRFLVCWLENRFVRFYEIEDRKRLNDTNSPDWNKYYDEYLQKLNIGVKSDDPNGALYELLSISLSHFIKDSESNNYMDMDGAKYQLKATSSLDNLDINSDIFKKRVYELATLLEIPHYPDHMIVLSACCNLIEEKFNKEEVEYIKGHDGKLKINYVELDKVPHGLSEKSDPLLKKIASVVRLLQIQKLRDLQTNVNVSIVSTQPIVADPKTDSSLGKVGR